MDSQFLGWGGLDFISGGKMNYKHTQEPKFASVRCPNKNCEFHNPEEVAEGTKMFRKHGYYISAQHGRIPRYMCMNCRKTFSSRTNDENYYLHYDSFDIEEIGAEYYRGKNQKDIAKKRGISIQMVRTRIKRFDPYPGGLFLEG